jgi:predicted aldo/keto reductase-like oxidoreductase
MQYREFGKLDWKPSALGFGAMRLPHIGSDMFNLDEEESIKMLRYGIDHGINYVDTAAPYANTLSEKIVGKALKDGYRQKVKLATKLTSFFMKGPDDLERFFNAQLERLQTDKIDFYLLHGLNKQSWKIHKEWKTIEFVEKKMAAGQVCHFGFSFHDEFSVFKEIVDSYDNWTFCQIQYNYLDADKQAGRQGLQYAAGKGLGVIIMEPIRGGNLANRPPEGVFQLWDSAPIKRTQADWALQWVWNQPEVSLLLSGMSNLQQVKENLESAERSGIGTLTKEELILVNKVKDAYNALVPIPCTKCQYCQPCPNGVAIPVIFDMFNESAMFDDWHVAMRYMGAFGGLPENSRADKCLECGECLEKCPQQIPITDWLKKAHAKLYIPDFKSPTKP